MRAPVQMDERLFSSLFGVSEPIAGFHESATGFPISVDDGAWSENRFPFYRRQVSDQNDRRHHHTKNG